MNLGKSLFAQLMDFLPWRTFDPIVDRHGGDRYGDHLRSDHLAQRIQKQPGLSRAPATHSFQDAESCKTLVFLTNSFTLPAPTMCALYKSRWQVELLFKWIKQHLRIKKFYGTFENAVKSQFWIVVSVYVLVAIVKKRLGLEASHIATDLFAHPV